MISSIEKQIKLFEDISTTDGDFSYAFNLQKTITNTRLLGNPQPDNISKQVWDKIPAKILSESGAETYNGFIRIERITNVYQCSFFAGNNNWFGMLSGKLADLDFSQYDIEQNQTTIQNAIFNTEGVVFPVLDNGALLTRGAPVIKVEDFVAGIYVKNVFNKIFSAHGIKIKGELLEDANYQTAITIRSARSQSDLDDNSCYVEKTSTTARTLENVQYQLSFQNDSALPYFNGGNFDISTGVFTAPIKMRVEIEANFEPSIVDATYNNRIYLWIDGSYPGFVDIGLNEGGLYNSATPGDDPIFTLKRSIVLEAGSTLAIASEWQQSGGSTQNDVVSGDVKITATYLYKAFGNAIVPDWTQQQYVSNILRLFNVLASYKEATQTLTLDLFEKIKSKTAIDLSEYISETEIDYTEFIAAYGKRSLLSYNERSEDNFKPAHFEYRKGEVSVSNDFLENEVDILESDFTNPISYINEVFDMSTERLNFIIVEVIETTECTAVTDNSGVARFTINKDAFLLADMVRISESTNQNYNGDYYVQVRTVETAPGAQDGYIEVEGLPYDTDAKCTISLLRFGYNDSDDVYLLHQVPLYFVPYFSGLSTIQIENTDNAYYAIAFFNILNTGRQVNKDFIYSLSFSGEGDQHYQQTMIEQYFRLFSRVLNDPVKDIVHRTFAAGCF